MKGQAMAAAVLAWAVASAAPGGGPDAVWEVGRFNGVPADGRAPLDPAQYRVREAEEPVFTVRGREAFPQTLRPGQVMVVPFDGLPRAALRLTVGVRGTRIDFRDAAQIMQVEVPAMPAPDAEAPMPAELARLFPHTLRRVPEGYGVMVIEIGLER